MTFDTWQDFEDAGWDCVEVGRLTEAAIYARQAIKINPNAIDAYVILARAAETDGERIAFLREGVRIGESQFEKELLAAPSDDFPFWGLIETRPFMRALQALSLVLFRDGRPGAKDEAVSIWRRLYAICPNDNLGVRFLIAEFDETGDVELDD